MQKKAKPAAPYEPSRCADSFCPPETTLAPGNKSLLPHIRPDVCPDIPSRFDVIPRLLGFPRYNIPFHHLQASKKEIKKESHNRSENAEESKSESKVNICASEKARKARQPQARKKRKGKRKIPSAQVQPGRRVTRLQAAYISKQRVGEHRRMVRGSGVVWSRVEASKSANTT